MNKFRHIFLIILTLLFLLSSPLYTYADNASGSGSGGGSQNAGSGGASPHKAGYRIYVIDENGKLKSKVIDLTYRTPTFDIGLSKTRLGNGKVKIADDVYLMPSDMPLPYVYKNMFVGNGIALKEWMRKDGNDNQQNIITIIEKYLGSDVADLFSDMSKEYYCVVEPITWHNVYETDEASGDTGVGVYGTFYNWMEFYYENNMKHGYFIKQLDNNVLGRCLTVEFEQANLNLSMPTSTGVLDYNILGNQGFGLQLYTNQDQDIQTTCDEEVGDIQHPAPLETSGQRDIVKNYRTKIKENEFIDDGCFTTNAVAQNIRIEDEESYKVVGWKVSNITTTIDSTQWETSIPGVIEDQGEEAKLINIKSPSTTLYVLLEKEGDELTTWDKKNFPETPGTAPDNPSGDNINIVKNYYTVDQNGKFISDDGCYIRTDAVKSISIVDEKNYEVVGWKISTSNKSGLSSEPSKWNAEIPNTITRTGNEAESVILEDAESSLYVLLKRIENKEEIVEEPIDTNYILSESSISRRIWLSNPDVQFSMPEIQNHEFIWILKGHDTSCSGHYYSDDCNNTDSLEDEDTEPDHCGGHTEYCSSFDWIDSTLRLSISNQLKNDFPDILTTKEAWRNESEQGNIVKKYYDYERKSVSDEYISTSNWDYVTVIHRGKDKLTLADWKNTESTKADLKDVSSSGYAVANTNQGTRKIADYIDKFSVDFVNEAMGTDNITKYGAFQAASFTGAKCSNDRGVILSMPLALNDISVKVKVYSGSQGAGVNDKNYNSNECLVIKTQNFNTSSGRMIQGTQTISFLPYIEMKYDSLTVTDKQAYVLGQYQRAITPNSYAEINWNKKSDDNLTLISSQWSTHAQPVKDYGTNNVLPGGANLGLGIKNSDRQMVEVTTYQVAVINELKTQVDKTGGSDGGLTEELATQNHNDYVETVREGLEHLVVQQYVDKNTKKNNAFDGIKVNPGSDISRLGNKSSKASKEDKYYFREESGDNLGLEGDLDVKVEGTNTSYIKISADTSGNILMNGNVVLTKGQDYNSLTGEAKLLDEKTYIIRKVAMALERNSGKDTDASWVSDGKWYNEAMDPLYVVVQRTKLTVGFINPTERDSILDPKLIPYTESKSELFTDYFISQFKMRGQSEIYQAHNVVGMFKGNTIQMKNMDMLFYSRPFWIPNVTVQDLK